MTDVFLKALAMHAWDLTPKDAIALQKELAARVRIAPLGSLPRFVVGVDSCFLSSEVCVAAAILWDTETHTVAAEGRATAPVTMPYIPGLLSFREGPALLAALATLDHPVDAIMCDGQGLAHPRRLGIACHLGVLTGLPTLGCGKTRLVGRYEEPAPQRGAASPLTDDDTLLGAVLRTRDHVKPVFISPGHRMTVDEAVATALACADGYRLPEPTRRADQAAAQYKTALLDGHALPTHTQAPA